MTIFHFSGSCWGQGDPFLWFCHLKFFVVRGFPFYQNKKVEDFPETSVGQEETVIWDPRRLTDSHQLLDYERMAHGIWVLC